MRRYSIIAFLVLVLLGSIRIISTYAIFSATYDEPAHLATGMEWLDLGTYRLEPQHPPLARVLTALGPYLAGARNHGLRNINVEGTAILSAGGTRKR